MTEVSRPWSGTSTGDAGPYSDNQWATTWMNMIGFGADSINRGVIRGVDNDLRVTAQSPASNAVDVNTGAAVVQGKWYLSDAVESFTISANGSGNPRIDTIVLRADYTAQTVRLALKTGTPAATPAAPSLTQTAGVTWEIPVADIEVANGFATITQDNIFNRQDWANVPNQVSVEIINNESFDLVPGQPVSFVGSASPREVALPLNVVTAPLYYQKFRLGGFGGVVAERIPASGGTGRVVIRGLAYIELDDTIGAMEFIGPSTNNQFTAVGAGNGTVGIWGISLEGGNADDRILALIDVPNTPLYGCVLEDTAFSIPNGGTFSAVSFGVGTEVFDPVDMHDLANPSRITVPITGLYLITANVIYAASAAYTLPVSAIRVDGATFISQNQTPSGTYTPAQPLAVQYTLTANQYVELVVYQLSGAARNAKCNLSVTRLESQ